MSVGFPAGKTEIDLRSGQAVVNLRESMDTIVLIKAWLDEQTDASLLGLNYTQAEVNLLKAAFTDLSNLIGVARGTRTQPGASDFFVNARKLTALS